jgi:hypothetical protein
MVDTRWHPTMEDKSLKTCGSKWLPLSVVIVSGVSGRDTYPSKNFSAIVLVEVSYIGIASEQREK